MNKQAVIHTHWNIMKPQKRMKVPFITTWIDLEMIILGEVSQTEKDSFLFLTILLCFTSVVQHVGTDYQVMGGTQGAGCED